MRRFNGIGIVVLLLFAGGGCASAHNDGCARSISQDRLHVLFERWKVLSIDELQELWAGGASRAEVTPADFDHSDIEVRFGHADANEVCGCCDDFYFSMADGQHATLSSVVFIRSFRRKEAALEAAEELWAALVAPGEIRKNIQAEALENAPNVFRLDGMTKDAAATAPINIQIWKDGQAYVVSVHIGMPSHRIS